MEKVLKNELLKEYATPHIGTPDLLISYPKGEEREVRKLAAGLADCYIGAVVPERRKEECYLCLKLPAPSAHIIEDLARFLDSPEMLAVHYNDFRGVFAMDLTEWVDAYDSEYFEMLLDYIEDHREEILFIFMARASLEDLNGLEEKLSQTVHLRGVYLGFSDMDFMYSQAVNLFSRSDIRLSKEAGKELREILNWLSEDPGFCGIRTMEEFVENCAYELHHRNGSHIFITGDLMKAVYGNFVRTPEKKKETVSIRPGFYVS